MILAKYWTLLLLPVAVLAQANTCGKLHTNNFVPSSHLGIKVFQHNDANAAFVAVNEIGNGSFGAEVVSLTLAPGWHHFRGIASCDYDMSKVVKNQLIRKLCSMRLGWAAGVNFSLFVEPGKSYKVAVKPQEDVKPYNEQKLIAEVIKVSDIECTEPGMAALSMPANGMNKVMPAKLNFKLGKVIKEITNDFKRMGYPAQDLKLKMPSRVNPIFGVTFDNTLDTQKGKLIVTVAANSVASSLNLQEGDTLISVGEFMFVAENEQIEDLRLRWQSFLSLLTPQDELRVKILRNKQALSWPVAAKALFIPAYEINIQSMESNEQ